MACVKQIFRTPRFSGCYTWKLGVFTNVESSSQKPAVKPMASLWSRLLQAFRCTSQFPHPLSPLSSIRVYGAFSQPSSGRLRVKEGIGRR